ncbi:hypothetical protein [Nesterenkonia flava]|uniref:PPE family domain-containing protein n=1 Tax=Nesterenkonia flava TaxID=469799 RepID=A0ABU1FWZ9_9MICC|nr:hypothetical protein [Nesterenkonia flava]MDR5712676.1 hypothetical protein [Nesterenkonia flava]
MVLTSALVPAVAQPPRIDVDFGSLTRCCSDLALAAVQGPAAMTSARGQWQGLREAYQESATEEIVWSAFEQVPQVAEAWGTVALRTAEILEDFARQGQVLAREAQTLEMRAAELSTRVSSLTLASGSAGLGEDAEALRQGLQAHHHETAAVWQRWQALQQQAASALSELSSLGGREDEIRSSLWGPAPRVQAISGLTLRGWRPWHHWPSWRQLFIRRRRSANSLSSSF